MPKTSTTTAEPLLTAAEVAERCGVTERQVRRWMANRWLGYVDLPKGRRVSESDLAAFLNNRTVKAAR